MPGKIGLKLVLIAVVSVALAQQAPMQATLSQAQASLSSGHYTQAVQEFEAIIAQDYTNYQAHLGLGLAFYDQGHYKEAQFEFTQLTLLDPKRYEGWFNLATVQAKLRDFQGAAQSFSQAVAIGEQNNYPAKELRPAYLGWVSSLQLSGNFAQAAQVAQQALAKLPQDPDLTYALALSLIKSGQPLQALPYLYELVRAQPNNVAAEQLIVQVYLSQGLTSRAQSELQQALMRVTDPHAKAQLLLEASTILPPKEALASLQQAVQLDPQLWQAQYNLGLQELQAGHPHQALAPLQAALAQRPQDPALLLALASAYDRLGQAQEEERYAAQAAQQASGSQKTDALLFLGKAQYLLQNYPKAVTSLGQVVQAEPQQAVAWLYLGLAQYHLGDYSAAITSLSKAYALAPSAAVAADLGAADLAAGRYSDAEALLRQAVAQNPDDAVAWYNLGWAYSSLGRTHEARQAWERALMLGYEPARALLK
jgi:tetratricopeptide (TPR) repeat protein